MFREDLLTSVFISIVLLIFIGIFDQIGYSEYDNSPKHESVEIKNINMSQGETVDLRKFPNNSAFTDNVSRIQVTEIEKEPNEELMNGFSNSAKYAISNVPNSTSSLSELPRIDISWNGLDIFSAAEKKEVNSTFSYTRLVNPPDITIGVGKNNVAQIVHSSIEIWNKTGSPLLTRSLYNFFNVSQDHFITDPKILYDNTSDHWFATIVDGGIEKNEKERYSCLPNGCKVLIAISNTGDPTQPWQIKEINPQTSGYFPDQPKITVNKFNFTIATTDFQVLPVINHSNFNHTVITLDKKFLISNNISIGKISYGTYFESKYPIPFTNPSKCTSTASLIKQNKTDEFSNVTGVKIYDHCNPKYLSHFHGWSINTPSKLSPAFRFKQPSLESDAATNNKMEIVILSAIRNDNSVWLALHSACTPVAISKQSCVNILRFDNTTDPDPNSTTGYKYIQTENTQFNVSGTDVYYPAIGMSADGKMFFISGFSNSSTFPSLMISHLVSVNYTKDRYLVLGSDLNNSTSFGDYFASAIDPIDGSVWLSGQYVDRYLAIPHNFPPEQLNSVLDKTWSTIIAKVS